jgi:hypothetical protein
MVSCRRCQSCEQSSGRLRHLIDPHVIGVAAGGEGEERVLAERVQSVAGAFLVEQANELQSPTGG